MGTEQKRSSSSAETKAKQIKSPNMRNSGSSGRSSGSGLGSGNAPLSIDDLRSVILSAGKFTSSSSSSSLSPRPYAPYAPPRTTTTTTSSSSRRDTIARACSCVEQWLEQNGEDHRAFFDGVFRVLLQEVFGLGKPKEKSWLYAAGSRGGQDARALRGLLDPNGALLRAVCDADDRNLYPSGFVFPIETLPAVAGVARTQSLLRRGAACLAREIPHYRGRLHISSSEGGKEGGKTEVRLSLWEYFVSWLVFYAIQEPTSSSSSSSSSSLRGRGPPSPFANLNDLSQLSWNAFAGTAKELFTGAGASSSSSRKQATPVYRDLLKAFVRHYLDFAGHRGGGGGGHHLGPMSPSTPPHLGLSRGLGGLSSAARAGHLSLGSPGTPQGAASPGAHAAARASSSQARQHQGRRIGYQHKRQFMLDVMCEFWLSDANQDGGMGAMRTAAFVCPSADLVQSVTLVVAHMVDSAREEGGGGASASAPGHPRQEAATSTPAGVGLRSLSSPSPPQGRGQSSQGARAALWRLRRLTFRFLLRCFALWPAEASASIKPVVDLWAAYAAPWEGMGVGSEGRGKKVGGATKPIGSLLRRAASRTMAIGGSPRGSERDPPGGSDASSRPRGERWQDWKDHVAGAMPFYTTLVRYFVNLECARAAVKPESALTDLVLLLGSLQSRQGELGSFLRDAERELHMHAMGSLTGSRHFERLAAYRHDHHDLVKFALGGLPSSCLLEEASGANYDVLTEKDGPLAAQLQQCVDVLGVSKRTAGVSRLRDLANMAGELVGAEVKVARRQGGGASAQGRRDKAGNGKAGGAAQVYRSFTWHDVVAFRKRYKGDWMRRPVSSYEIAAMVALWVRVSEAANAALGLDGNPSPEWLQQRQNLVVAMLASLLSWCKHRGYRVNLRFLSGWFPTLAMALYIASVFLLGLGWWPLLVLFLCILSQS